MVDQVKPELCIFIHLGIVMIKHDPAGQAAMCEDATGVRTVAGEDLMTLDIDRELSLGKAQTYPDDEWIPGWAPDMPEGKR
jgi:hypothetical protein